VIGAAAHRLGLAVGRLVSAADRRRKNLFDEARAGAAGRRSLGVFAHVVEREQPLFLDRLDDGAFAHAVAAAHFHGIRHSGSFVLALVAGVAEVVLTEKQVIANFGNALLIAQQLVIPGAVAGVAVQHAADDPVVLDHQLLVHAA